MGATIFVRFPLRKARDRVGGGVGGCGLSKIKVVLLTIRTKANIRTNGEMAGETEKKG